ncbi:50S ribosomal protein L24 [Candidatus Kaiserbacteria bacterium RIFCSPHIGHO2_02_FULL_59_21]|uniref:Large ribosomal subunit protein uL24 n=2 Tax=Candidatus Kaiseribacteriota TaxID=1752734 RepID=A0A0G2B0D0_9BACT|nr:MAG: 50S ribosomal protein L24 [Candidatus Kaiserbacteria bacterium GW2011_GWA2_58_9]OGG63315.1 MAG: 50S ribosomal protein L24 [Candidatus Kaiserbacteria bacterium RIFCSPHIGHO2_01_FULL_58_22]OGG66634.1 MAG: 50S ribosomal protein L24 [Candidatus Kaiserbacteria bacterium RIFCSPHIGHO2_02_FULL_59_21]OGG78991.1 MAG: 50S ribosomal protein L24 [Candidatus Kaiserbacteria bacterium RIFCSPLOWO2_01_FULL_59_34]OGG84385.1 MAG: 50S ribosomal protein L24 [Candidatus Kaiserbacteria bacterium RIFCSPLOWO2_02_
MKLRKGDKVVVIAGKSRGQSGTIVRVLPHEDRVVLDGVNLAKRHRKPSAQNRKGQIIERAMPLHASNVMLADPKSGKPTRVKIVRGKDGARERVAVKSGQALK